MYRGDAIDAESNLFSLFFKNTCSSQSKLDIGENAMAKYLSERSCS